MNTAPSRTPGRTSRATALFDQIAKHARIVAVVAVVTFLLIVVSGDLKTMAGEIVAVWFTDGYVLARLMTSSRSQRPAILLGAFIGGLAANLKGGESLYVATAFTLSGIVEACVADWLVPRVRTAAELVRPQAFLRFVIVAGALAPTVSGLFALLLLKGVFTSHPFTSFSNWVISTGLGFIIFTPFSLALLSGEWKALLRHGNRARSLALLVLVGGVTAGIFSQTQYAPLYWALPPLALLAFQAELSTVLLGMLLFIAIAITFTVRGSGPLWADPHESMQDRILSLQFFTVAALSILLPITVLQAQRSRLIAMLADGHRRYRVLAEHSDELVVQLTAEGRFEYLSPRVFGLIGADVGRLAGTPLVDWIHEQDRARVEAAIAATAGGTNDESVRYRLARADGAFVWVQSLIAAMPVGLSDASPGVVLTLRDVSAQVEMEQQRVVQEEKLKRLAYVDSLTGLKNRRYFDEQIVHRLEAAAWSGDTDGLAVLFIDVDYFKAYNDYYGHQEGDRCLHIAAAQLAASVREDDLLARYGGEEFVVALHTVTFEEAVAIAERIRDAVAALQIPHPGSPFGIVTLSVGLAGTSAPCADEGRALLKNADAALYEAKRLGRNRVFSAGVSDTGPAV